MGLASQRSQTSQSFNKMKCSKPQCKREYDLLYMGKPLCWKHWSQLCDKELKSETKGEELQTILI